jgi:tRNA(Ile2) C34 agmatinyltransferase TiaS
MTSALLESPLSLFGEARPVRAAGGRGITLEERLESALRSVHAEGVAECPVCHGRMHAEAAAARCSRCGSTLS